MENPKFLDDADKDCRSRNATLFVADSLEEYNDVINLFGSNKFIWIGLHKANVQEKPHWRCNSTTDYKKLKWLMNKPYSDTFNGWTIASQCAAQWNPSTKGGKYMYWYPCFFMFHYIC